MKKTIKKVPKDIRVKKGWRELNRVVKKLYKKGKVFDYSDEIRIRFNVNDSGFAHKSISIFSEELDNCYNKKEGWRWEIFLNEDGTWKID